CPPLPARLPGALSATPSTASASARRQTRRRDKREPRAGYDAFRRTILPYRIKLTSEEEFGEAQYFHRSHAVGGSARTRDRQCAERSAAGSRVRHFMHATGPAGSRQPIPQ